MELAKKKLFRCLALESSKIPIGGNENKDFD